MVKDGRLTDEEVPLRNAMNEVLRDEYVSDCERACARWNKRIQESGLTGFELKIPSRRFNRSMGIYADHCFDLEGQIISEGEFEKRKSEWLPTAEDRAYVQSVMVPCYEPGKFAPWIAPPRKGVKGKGVDFEYVKFASSAR